MRALVAVGAVTAARSSSCAPACAAVVQQPAIAGRMSEFATCSNPWLLQRGPHVHHTSTTHRQIICLALPQVATYLFLRSCARLPSHSIVPSCSVQLNGALTMRSGCTPIAACLSAPCRPTFSTRFAREGARPKPSGYGARCRIILFLVEHIQAGIRRAPVGVLRSGREQAQQQGGAGCGCAEADGVRDHWRRRWPELSDPLESPRKGQIPPAE